ncbi:CHAT domain-containing protein [Enterocloster bolteae]|uniref:CHAT domain-containing protein n=1 Tax=Enterocloster bolteae TaxID=208479 RepID=UPI00210EF0DA|nr:CHAT domain-containing protein [Enterocloster bolteae]MCQ5141454.1 CHAT domain-containing protein [Enterocloster bolteae]
MEYDFIYFVVFKSSNNNFSEPIILFADSESIRKSNNGTMHLLDENLNVALDAIEYIMHLPRNKFDIYDLDEEFMAASYDTPHQIILIPDYFFVNNGVDNVAPTMFILTDNCSIDIKTKCEKSNPLLGTYYIHELNQELIKKQWEKISQLNGKNDFKFNPVKDLDIHYRLEGEKLKALPVLFISRQFGKTTDLLSEIYNCTDVEKKCIDIQWKNISHLNTLNSMNDMGITHWDDKANKIYDKEFINEARKFDISVVVTLPGVSKLQKKYGLSAGILSENEKRAIRILGVHRAIARSGVLLELSCVKEELYNKYDELEQRCKNGTNNKYVWKSFIDLGKLLGRCFDSFQIEVLRRAKDITIFSDFPIGLAILESDEVPLQCYKEISYRTLTPLTRQLQIELQKENQVYLGKKCKVAIAECIIDNEENRYVYLMCELVHSTLANMEQKYEGFSVVYQQTYSVNNIIKFINDNKDADILYISAHGYYNRRQNMAGIMVGDEFWMASEDINVPPIVILSACHASPRGMGAVNIADMFIRNGAITVLGTFIPVDAHRNLILMTRLFTYIVEAQHGNRQYKTLNEAWCGVVATNAIHELMSESKSFNEWMHDTNSNGKPRIIDFQLERCVGKLRSTHIYSDTIKIVKEMLEEEGMEGKFGNILNKHDFFPESFFYQFIGYPENIFLYNDIFEDAYNKKL